jgi:transcription initiation factor IIE alpha subunit
MHDSIAMKKPGNCPICGMKLNLSKKEEAHITNLKKYVCPSHPQKVADKPGKCSVCGMSLNLSPKEKAKLGYACPMHPNEKSDKSGKCPNCGMVLTPVKKS